MKKKPTPMYKCSKNKQNKKIGASRGYALVYLKSAPGVAQFN